MARVLIVAPSPVPFVFGGAERFWWDLCRALQQYTPHEVELWKLPSPERTFAEVLGSYRRFFDCDVSHFDCVVATKYPAWMVDHPRKIVYLQHKLRGLYDTYPAQLPTAIDWPEGGRWQAVRRALEQPPSRSAARALFAALEELLQGDEGHDPRLQLPSPLLRACVRFWDAVGMAPATVSRYVAISKTVRDRCDYFPAGVAVAVAPHPSSLPVRAAVHKEREEVVFIAVSRLEAAKRLDWVIEAFCQIPHAHARLWVVGDGPQATDLRALAEGDARVAFLGRLSDAALAERYQQADVAVFVPREEDMGLVTLEAMGSGCAVLTCSDSGGVTEFVEPGVCGWICPPSVESLAQQMSAIAGAPHEARAMGTAAVERARRIDWRAVIEQLGLDSAGLPQPAASGPRTTAVAINDQCRGLLVLSPFALNPPLTGGPKRVFELYRALSRWVPVRVLCAGGRQGRVRCFDPQLVVEDLGAPDRWQETVRHWSETLGVSAGDWALWAQGERWRVQQCRVRRALHGTVAVVLTHPYAAALLPGDWEGPVIYDAHNVECILKQQMWRGACAADALRWLCAAERGVVRRADVVWTVSAEDRERLIQLWPDLASRRRWVCVANGWNPAERCFQLRADKAALRAASGLANADWRASLMIGSWHEPNVDATLWWLREAVPRMPAWHHWLAGTVGEHPEVRRLAAATSVRCVGAVSDEVLRGMLAVADVGWNPMALGSGSNLKMLDYAGSGALIATTPFGSRGYDFVTAQTAVVAERDRLVDALLDSPDLKWDEMRQASRVGALAYSWERVAQQTWVSIREWWHD